MGQLYTSKAILQACYNDATLQSYMGIPTADQSKIAVMRDKYVVNIFATDALLINEISRIVWRNDKCMPTSNPEIKRQGVIFEVFVKIQEEYTVDVVDRLKSRSEAILWRLHYIFHNQMINGFKWTCVDIGELYSATNGYKRCYIKFEHAMIG